MKKFIFLSVILVAIITIGVMLFAPKTKAPINPGYQNALIEVDKPLPSDIITSPLIVSGKARGYWFFEASFPIKLLDGNGKQIAVVPAQAQGEWMTEEFVPYEAKLEFPLPATDSGTLILEKDNPSGLPEHAAEIRLPVRFR